MRKWGIGKAVVMILLLMSLLSGCGSASHSRSDSAKSSVDDKASKVEMTSTSNMAMESPKQDSGEDLQSIPEGSSASAGSGFQAADVLMGMNKKLIYKANVVMQVDDYSKAQSQIRNQVTLAGGYIVDFSENRSLEEEGGTFTIKVPSAGFSSFLDQIDKLEHQSLQRSIQGQDVSEEYVDLEARLKVKQAMEARYLKFIDEATKTSQLVEYVNELERIQTEIEQIKGRMRYIDSNVSFSTVEIRLYQPDVETLQNASHEKSPLLERAGKSLNGSIRVISAMFEWLVVVLAGAIPVFVIGGIILVMVWLVQRAIRNRARYNPHRTTLVSDKKEALHPEADESLPEDEDNK